LFVDTSGWASVADRRQTFHTRAAALVHATIANAKRIVTTNLVLIELSALLTSPLRIPKLQQVQFLDNLRSDPDVEIVCVDTRLETDAWNLWRARLDKEWTMTDCTSFLVMQQRGLQEVLTTDHHFEQAAFVRLLK
jgi:predicted nucleic acid-binding protein